MTTEPEPFLDPYPDSTAERENTSILIQGPNRKARRAMTHKSHLAGRQQAQDYTKKRRHVRQIANVTRRVNRQKGRHYDKS